jgi:hypothetical protein
MLVPVAISGLVLLRARRTYPRDVATAAASIAETTADDDRPPVRSGADASGERSEALG